MSSTGKETNEERASRVAALKAHGALQKKIAEKRNILSRMMKGEMHQDDQAHFREVATSLYRILTELRKCTVPGSDVCFNNLLETLTPELLAACNESVSTLTPKIDFASITRHTGPDEEAGKSRQLLEEKQRRKEELAKARVRRQPLGFNFGELNVLQPWLIHLILMALTTPPCRDDEKSVVRCEMHRVLCNQESMIESIVTLRNSYEERLKSRRMCSFMMKARRCMTKNPECSTCTLLSIIYQMAHDLNRGDAEKVEAGRYHPPTDLNDALLFAAVNRLDPNFCHLVLDTYFLVTTFYDETVKTHTIPNIRVAITNPESEIRKELIGALTEHIETYSKDQVKMKEAKHNVLFEEWKKWYGNPISNSAFKPYSFLLPL